MKLKRIITVHCALVIGLYFVFLWIVLLLSMIHQRRDQINRPTWHGLATPSQMNKTEGQSYKENLLREDHKVSKVIILTYVRSGSSIFSELFDVGHSISVRWYEPLDSFYAAHFGLNLYSLALPLLYHSDLTRRTPSKLENAVLTKFLQSLLSCDFDRLPIETLTHSEFLKKTSLFQPQLKSCLPDPSSSLYHCTQILREICGGSFDDTRRNLSVAMYNECPKIIQKLRKINISNMTGTETNSKVFTPFSNIQRSVEKRQRHFLKTQHSETQKNEFRHSILQDRITDNNMLERQCYNFPHFLEHRLCLERLEIPVRKCLKLKVQQKCKRATVVAAKLVRATVSDIAPLISKKTFDVKVIYFVRDPRAIALSRAHNSSRLTYFADDTRVTTEARFLCTRMKDDIEARNSLLEKYPESILTIRYEDFVLTHKETIDRVFKYIGQEQPVNIHAWIRKTMKGRSDNGPFGTTRVNSTASVNRWKNILGDSEIAVMNRYCGSVIKSLGYNI